MKKYLFTVMVMAVFAIGFTASDETESSNANPSSPSATREQTDNKEQNEEQASPKKSKKDEIRELGYNDGVLFGRSDRGDALRSYVQMGSTIENGLEHIQHVIARVAYKEDYGDDISEELLDEYCEQFIEGYKSIVIKK